MPFPPPGIAQLQSRGADFAEEVADLVAQHLRLPRQFAGGGEHLGGGRAGVVRGASILLSLNTCTAFAISPISSLLSRAGDLDRDVALRRNGHRVGHSLDRTDDATPDDPGCQQAEHEGAGRQGDHHRDGRADIGHRLIAEPLRGGRMALGDLAKRRVRKIRPRPAERL